jgi:tape measure domain-containing protein
MAITAAQLMVKVGADIAEAQAALDRVKQKLQEVSGGAREAGENAVDLGAFLKGAAQQMLGFSSAMGAMRLVGDAFKAWRSAAIDFNASLEQTSIAFTTMLGSAVASKEMLDELQEFAMRTPFSFPELVDATRRLLAMGYAAEEVIPILTDVGNAAAALGLGDEGIDRITLALGQMRAATKVNAQDMRQLTETGIPAWQILADAIGKTVGETQKLAAEGQIASETFIEAFREFSQARYGDMMAEQARTAAGAWQNLLDISTRRTAEQARPIFDALSHWAQDLVAGIERQEAAKEMLVAFKARLESLNAEGRLTAKTMRDVAYQADLIHAGFMQGAMSVDEFRYELNDLARRYPELATAIAASTDALATYNAAIDGGLVRNMEFAATVGAVKDALADLQKQAAEQAHLAFETEWADSATQIQMLEGRLAKLTVGSEEYFSTLSRLNRLYQEHADSERGLAFAMADRAGKIAIVREELAKLTPGTTEYNEKMRELVLLEQSGASSTRELASQLSSARDALVRLNPAAQAAAMAVAMWESRIAAINGALRANEGAVRAAQEHLRRMQEELGNLNDALSEAKRRLDEFTHPRLTGMGEMEMQISAIEAQLKRMDLAESLGVPLEEVIAKYPLLTEGAEAYLETLPTTKDELEKLLDQLRLMQSLSFDEKLRLLERAANPLPPEMSYEEALAGITRTREEIATLTGQIATQEAAIRAQERAIEALQAAANRLNDTLREYQDQLQQAQRNQDLVNRGLELAYMWFLENRKKIVDLGSEGVTQAAIVDQKARELLSAISGFAGDTTALSEETLAGLITSFQESSARAVLEVQKNLGNIPKDIWTTHHILTVYEGATLPGRAAGGPVAAGKPYIVGEQGPEVFVPNVSGVILPAQRDGFGAAAGGDVYIDKIVVQGSVMTARGLAEDVRQEFIRTMKRNGSVGF